MKNKYTVNVHYDYVATIEVIAENEREAMIKANEMAEVMPVTELECFDYIDSCVTDISNI